MRHSSERVMWVMRTVKPRKTKWGTTEVVDSRITFCGVHSWNLSLYEELVGIEFMRELISLVRVVKHI